MIYIVHRMLIDCNRGERLTGEDKGGSKVKFKGRDRRRLYNRLEEEIESKY